MRKIKKILFFIIIIISMLVLSMPVEASSKLSINKVKTTLYIGTPINLKVSGTNSRVKWSSSNKSIASVSSKGIVTGKKEGTVKITAKVDGKKLTCKVTVKKPSVNYTSKNLNIGETTKLKLTGAKVKSFKSSNKSIATVSSKGVVTAKKVGTVIITVTDVNKKKYKCEITVKCDHTYNEEITSFPTCTKDGVRLYTCRCGDSYTEKIPQLEHNYDDKFVDATCTDKGYMEHKCSMCGRIEKDTYINAKGHKWGEWTVIKNATEDVEGKKERKCTICNESISTVVPKLMHVHDYSKKVYNSTCTEQGYTLHTCSKCGDSYKDNYINELGHIDHWSIKEEATCKQDGIKENICDRCHNIIETKTIDKIDHDYEEEDVNPTCIEKGYTIHTCSKCGDSYKDDYKSELGHIEHWSIKEEATCKQDGIKENICDRCHNIIETKTIDKIDHDYEEEDVNPTCIEKGYTIHTCSKCNDSYKDSYINELGHIWSEWEEKKPATEESVGVNERECSRCREIDTEEIPIVDNSLTFMVKVEDGDDIKVRGVFCEDKTEEFLQMVNDYREENGFDRLPVSDEMTEIAKERAVQCSVHFDHALPWDKSETVCSYYEVMAENIATGSSDVKVLFDALKASSGHNENMLTDYSCGGYCRATTGVAVFERRIDGIKVYFLVQVFNTDID